MPEGTKKSNRKDVAEQKLKNLADIGSKGAFQINVPILFICILLATLFWLFNRLAEDFKYDYSYQLSYLNQSEEKIFVAPLPKKIELNVKGSGWKHLRQSLFRSDRNIDIDLEDFKSINVISSDLLKNYLNKRLPSNFLIQDSNPNHISLGASEGLSKKVPISINSLPEVENGYAIIKPIKLNPDSVYIKGVESTVNNVTELRIDIKHPTALSENLKGSAEVNLLGINKKLAVSSEEIEYELQVEPLTDKTIEVPISLIKSGPNDSVLILPDKVLVNFQTTISSFDLVQATDFLVVADLRKVDLKTAESVELIIEQSPENIANLKLEQKNVEFILIDR